MTATCPEEGVSNNSETFTITIADVTLDPPGDITDMTYTVQATAASMTFSDYTPSDGAYALGTLSYSASYANDDPLDSWITFTPATRTFSV